MTFRLLESIVSLIRSWLTIDRIRTGESLRQLSSLEVGETLFVHGEPAVVADRRLTHTSDASVLTIDCITDNGPAILCIRCGAGSRESQFTWERSSVKDAIQLDDLVVPTKRP
jgi:hypothetical protein